MSTNATISLRTIDLNRLDPSVVASIQKAIQPGPAQQHTTDGDADITGLRQQIIGPL